MQCCMNCGSREQGCHDRCAKYLAYSMVAQEEMEVAAINKNKDKRFYEHKRQVCEHLKKRRKK